MTDGYQVMPTLTDDEYTALRDDIAANGIIVPVVYDQHANVLDGHHRLKIAAELDITEFPAEIRKVDDDQAAREIAFTLNLARRHLSRAQRRELIAAEIEADPDRSDRAIGRMLGVDHKTVGSVRRESTGEIPHDEEEPGLRPDHLDGLVESEEDVRRVLASTAYNLLDDRQRSRLERRVNAKVPFDITHLDPEWMRAMVYEIEAVEELIEERFIRYRADLDACEDFEAALDIEQAMRIDLHTMLAEQDRRMARLGRARALIEEKVKELEGGGAS